MLKDSIKDIINNGGIVKMPYKSKINSWFGEYSIYKFEDEISISPSGKLFKNIDEAIDVFYDMCFTSKNVGLLQERLNRKNLISEDEFDFERPSDKLKELFKKEAELLDEELKTNK